MFTCIDVVLVGIQPVIEFPGCLTHVNLTYLIDHVAPQLVVGPVFEAGEKGRLCSNRFISNFYVRAARFDYSDQFGCEVSNVRKRGIAN